MTETRPLHGMRVAVTRPAEQAEELAGLLRAQGADVLIAPLIKVVPAPVTGPLQQAISEIDTYDWLGFSSANGVELFLRAFRSAGGSQEALRKLSIACVGPATAAAAQRHDLRVSVIPEEFVGDALPQALAAKHDVAGKRILLARAGGARMALPETLRKLGALVSDVEVYRSVPDEAGAARLRERLQANAIDVVTLTSASAARFFARHVAQDAKVVIAVIGPVTASEARQQGLPVTIEAATHTVDGLVAALSAHRAAADSRRKS